MVVLFGFYKILKAIVENYSPIYILLIVIPAGLSTITANYIKRVMEEIIGQFSEAGRLVELR